MDLNPKQFAHNSPNVESPLVSNRDEYGKDDDDPLSIKDVSSTVIGFILAVMTLFLPAISVLLERPFLDKTGIIYNQVEDKDGY